MLIFAWGLFKKVVVADRLALFVNAVYGDVHVYTGLPLVLATWFYAFQLYFDFSGYTDMALGSARLFNINLTQNFNSPYLATSVAEFWRRWHISFSRWILDYIFKPLQMAWRDWRTAGTAASLVVTFLASGIWHGVSWGFVVWGGLHGVYLATSVYYRPWQKKIHKALGITKSPLLKVWQTVVTFNLVCFAWIFFRANSLSDAFYIIGNLFRTSNTPLWSGGFSKFDTLVIAGIIPVYLLLNTPISQKISSPVLSAPMPLRWSLYLLLAAGICILYEQGGYFLYSGF